MFNTPFKIKVYASLIFVPRSADRQSRRPSSHKMPDAFSEVSDPMRKGRFPLQNLRERGLQLNASWFDRGPETVATVDVGSYRVPERQDWEPSSI